LRAGGLLMDKMVVTGGAGFIGSNMVEFLLARGIKVVLVDNFSTGREENLEGWIRTAGDRAEVVRADVNETARMRAAFQGSRCIFHLAAIPSVATSLTDPKATHESNISGTLSVLLAARDAGVARVVVASSCAVYGDEPVLPLSEKGKVRPLSPYALSKWACEEYGRLFHRLYRLETVCLRYFNVFGPRQDPRSEYAAVVPRWATRMLRGERPIIYGDGEQTRDFIFVGNILEANWRAAHQPGVAGEIFNIGSGMQTNLNKLIHALDQILGTRTQPIFEAPRTGEVRHSVADVSKARNLLGYSADVGLEEGLRRVLDWYRAHPG